MSFTLDELDQRLAVRAKASAEESYTARLLAAGVERCARKLGEEAV
jgi:phosphoribosyl-ATP pyrophosphohydrolase